MRCVSGGILRRPGQQLLGQSASHSRRAAAGLCSRGAHQTCTTRKCHWQQSLRAQAAQPLATLCEPDCGKQSLPTPLLNPPLNFTQALLACLHAGRAGLPCRQLASLDNAEA